MVIMKKEDWMTYVINIRDEEKEEVTITRSTINCHLM